MRTYEPTPSVGQPRPVRPLDRIAAAADRASALGDALATIISRFHDTGQGGETAETDVISVSYLANIDRLHANLDRVDSLISQLAEAA